jgi:arylsulfatase
LTRRRALLGGAALGALIGIGQATYEVASLATMVRGLGFRWDLLAMGILIYGGLGMMLGLLLGAIGARLLVPWRPRPQPAEPEAPPPRSVQPITRRTALQLGAGAASMCVLGALTHAAVDWSTGSASAALDPTPTPDGPPRALGGDEVLAVQNAVDPPPPAATPAGASTAPESPPPPKPRGQGPPNVLLITLDTVRADQLGAYGHPFVKTPSMDKLARDGALFERHVVQQPQTNPSHAALFTGMYPAASGIRTHMVDRVPNSLQTLATLFAGAGYSTAAFYSWMSFDPQYSGLQRGFQTYKNTAPGQPTALENPAAREAAANYRVAKEYLTLPRAINQVTGVQRHLEETAKGRADLTTDAAVAQVRQMADKPFFMWAHYFDPHYPYRPPNELAEQYDPGYRGPIDSTMDTIDKIENGQLLPQGEDLERLIALYQGELTFMDMHIGRLLATLDELSLRDNTIVVLVADHGEAFGEHVEEIVGNPFFHPHGLFENEQRTPLIVRYPPKVKAGTVVGAPVQSIDLFPTVLELAGQPVPSQNQGKSLLGLLDGTEDGAGRAAFSAMSDFTFTSVTVPGWKYIQNNGSGRRQLYDLRADPGEQHDLSDAKPDLTKQLAAKTQAWMKAVGI